MFSLKPLSTTIPLPFSLTNLNSSHKELYSTCLFGTSFVSLAWCPQGSSKLEHVSEFPKCLRLSNISSYVYTMFCLSIYQLMDICFHVIIWTCLSICFLSVSSPSFGSRLRSLSCFFFFPVAPSQALTLTLCCQDQSFSQDSLSSAPLHFLAFIIASLL